MLTRVYLRASTDEQDAARAKDALQSFAKERGLKVASYYVESESGASLQRPELFRLLADCAPGDAILIEQVVRLSRLNSADWDRLKGEIHSRQIRVIALDLPTSWIMASADTDPFTTRMFQAINDMMLDMLAAIARKDYEDRRRRQAEGVRKAKESPESPYKGRPENVERNATIGRMLDKGVSYTDIQKATGCSRATIAKVQAKRKGEASAA